MAEPELSFADVSFSYRGDWLNRIHALTTVSLLVPQASAFGFLGANGAGKSTSIKLLMGLLHGHRGDIRLFGQPLGDHRARARLGYLPEQPYFYDNLAVGEYLVYLAKLSGMSAADIPAACDRVYQLLDLGDLRTRKLKSFSKGMRQRFGLAQAIVHRPDLLVLDEPFSGLDPLWRARFKQVMALERARGATLFFSSHILSDVEDLCDHYAVIDHGRVLEQGRLADLMGSSPIELTGSGPKPAGAEDLPDGTWRVLFAESERAERLAHLPAGAQILRLDRQRIALEDWFVARVRAFHGAGAALPTGARTGGAS
ncbi:MAG: ABC transporter ATP-binding protein [Planctomycetes bacterium]|nr:ABC transporter ATP-binding protein [Planctomycetota bacterium]